MRKLAAILAELTLVREKGHPGKTSFVRKFFGGRGRRSPIHSATLSEQMKDREIKYSYRGMGDGLGRQIWKD